ncbi:galactosyltransferase-related protein [Amycolatopsis sp. FU40]|uniref:galactosyltransferase-related protein n=1 Tax=Amycolatopsis sp. FU40 TaxID=2914159 RepID=UPI001F41A79B|nr:galactosyltransferase-related protein [Amycolatopsis sp. FU40]UKD51073.1 galactosyltransferase-related protein [Amycolatopsis sp. FU40]
MPAVKEDSCDSIAAQYVEYIALALDPATRTISATSWEHSAEYYRWATEKLVSITKTSPEIQNSYNALRASPTDPEPYFALRNSLALHLAASPAIRAEISQHLDQSLARNEIGYHVGTSYRRDVAAVHSDMLQAKCEETIRREPPRSEVDVQIIIPFRDSENSGRLRNLLALLLALQDQSMPRHRYATTVVEADEIPRWKPALTPFVDHYLFACKSGKFNKSWTVNTGVVNTEVKPKFLCILDADMLPDRHFLARNAARLSQVDNSAHLPYHRGGLLSLDAPASNASIKERCFRAEPEVDLSLLRGHVLLAAPGGSVWTHTSLFHRIGGFDERYEGWGGEDDDFVDRLTEAGTFRRFSDYTMHLHHSRPQMRAAGHPFNSWIQPHGWTSRNRYGQLTKFLHGQENQGDDA